ncbi:MAG: MFS transporter [Chloroflexota bacterium]
MNNSKGLRARSLIALGFGFFIDSAEDLALPMLFPAIRNSLGLLYSHLGLIDNVRIIFQTFSGPFWGMLADKYNRKWILVIGTGLWGIWTALCGLVDSFWQLLALRVVACIGLGCLYPAAFSIMGDIFGPKDRGKAMGTISAIGMFGIVVGAVTFGQLTNIPEIGWRIGLVGLGFMSIISGVVIAVLIKNPVRGQAEPELSDVIKEEDETRFAFSLVKVKEVLRSKTLWINFIQGAFVMTTLNALSIFLVTWLVDDRGFSEADAPLFFGGVVISLAVGSFVAGIVADWADQRSPRYGRIICSQASIAITLPALLYLFTKAHTVVEILVPSIVAGFFIDWTRRGTQQPMAHAVTKPELRSTAMALMEFTQGSFASVVIILFGNYANQFGLTRTLLILTVGFWTIALLLTTFYYFVYPKEAAHFRQEMQNRREILLAEN